MSARVNEYGQPIGAPVPNWTTRPRPAPTAQEGRFCWVEPLRADHAPALHRALADDRLWTYIPVGPFDTDEAFAGYLRTLLDNTSTATRVIVDSSTGLPAGMAIYLRVEPSIGSIEVGGIVFAPTLQRTPAATEAMYLMARHAFDDLGYRRYEWKCDSLNAPSRAAARRFGFAPEGVWRNAIVYKGRNRDTAWFAMTDADWSALRAEFEAWLDPSNFDDGRQRTRLSDRTTAVRERLDAPSCAGRAVSDPTGTTGVSGAAEAGTSAADLLRHQWALSCDRLVRSLGGLSDEEFRREPVEGCWSVRPDPEHPDRWLMDYPDEVPDPPPFTTISWRLLHVTHGNWIYAEDGFGPGRRTYTDLPIFGNALEAVADLVASQEVVTSVLAAADDASLAHEVSTPSGEPRAAWQVLATLVDEQTHHGAEISLLRELYRAG